ncbi:MAG: molybdopterin synthase catalytic subunit [Thermogutta sp.]
MSDDVRAEIVDGPLPEAEPWMVPGAGAILTFEGRVRPEENGRPISALEYESYDPMARAELLRLAREAARRFALLGVEVVHSRGRVPVRCCSFRLRVAAVHRKEALAAVDWYVDRLKQEVPIWKRAAVAEGTTDRMTDQTAHHPPDQTPDQTAKAPHQSIRPLRKPLRKSHDAD